MRMFAYDWRSDLTEAAKPLAKRLAEVQTELRRSPDIVSASNRRRFGERPLQTTLDEKKRAPAWNGLKKLADMAGKVEITVRVESAQGLDQAKLENGVREPLRSPRNRKTEPRGRPHHRHLLAAISRVPEHAMRSALNVGRRFTWGVVLSAIIIGCKHPEPPLAIIRNDDASKPLVFQLPGFETNLVVEGKPILAYPRDVVVEGPDGKVLFFSESNGTLQGAKATIAQPLVGTYRVYQSRLEGLTVDRERVREGEKVRVLVKSHRFPNGTKVAFVICPSGVHCGPRTTRWAVGQGVSVIKDNAAQFDWVYHQPFGEPPAGEFRASVTVGACEATTQRPVVVERFPLEDLRGVCQVLKELGLYRGEILDKEDPSLKQAISQFQSTKRPCSCGVAGDGSFLGCHIIVCELGGMNEVPLNERGKLGPVTRKMIACTAGQLGWPADP